MKMKKKTKNNVTTIVNASMFKVKKSPVFVGIFVLGIVLFVGIYVYNKTKPIPPPTPDTTPSTTPSQATPDTTPSQATPDTPAQATPDTPPSESDSCTELWDGESEEWIANWITVNLKIKNKELVSDSTRAIVNLAANISNIKNNLPLKALLYNDLGGVLRNLNSDLFIECSRKAVDAWAEANNFTAETLVSSSSSIRLTDEFHAYVEEYQRKLRLEVTGRLDYDTLSITAGKDVGPFREDIYPDPSSVDTRID